MSTYNKTDNAPKANKAIKATTVRLINENGDMVGVVPFQEALKMAEKAGLDLVEMPSTQVPPVCKIMHFGKYSYLAKKKIKEARKKQKTVETKEIKLRPNIGQNDYEVKLRSIIKFINEGNKVKVSLRFKGREVTYQELGVRLLEKLRDDVQDISKVEFTPKVDGNRQLLMMISPKTV